MAKALLFLQRTLSNCCSTRPQFDSRRWPYQWKDTNKSNFAEWWTDEESFLTALIRFNGQTRSTRVNSDRILDFTAKAHTDGIEDKPVSFTYSNLNDLNSDSGIGDPVFMSKRISQALRDWLRIDNPSDRDIINALRFYVRNPEGPIVKTALLCWPETVLFALDYLETRECLTKESEENPFGYFNKVIPTRRLREVFCVERAEKELLADTALLLSARNVTSLPGKNGGHFANLNTVQALTNVLDQEGYCKWVSGETPSRRSFMAQFLDLLREDFESNERFDQNLHAFVCSLSGLCKLLIRLGTSEESRVHLPLPPSRLNRQTTIPGFLPKTLPSSMEKWERVNTTFAALDVIAALYYVAIYGPKDVTYLFSKPRVGTFTGSDSVRASSIVTLTRKPVNLFVCEYHGKRLIETGEVFIAYPGQSCVITSKDGDYACNCLKNVRLIESTYRRISDTHIEIAYNVKGHGEWTLFDRGKDGNGSKKGTLIIRGREYICLGRTKNADSVDVLFQSNHSSFEVVFKRRHLGDVFYEGPYVSKHDTQSKDLWCGVVLRPQDIICPSAPIIDLYLKTLQPPSPSQISPSERGNSYRIDVAVARALPWDE